MANFFDVRDLAVSLYEDMETTQKWLVMVCGDLSEVTGTCRETKPTMHVAQVKGGGEKELDALRAALRAFVKVI